MEAIYYDGTKLLSLKDINGRPPELILCTTNRTGGKTTFFSRFMVKKYLNGFGKFMLLYRYNYELNDVAQTFFQDIGSLFFQGMVMTSKNRVNGLFKELFLDDKSCGFAVSYNSAEQLKKYSHMFKDVNRMFMDEFQSETNHYCTDEIKKFLSIHTTVARGQGEQVRFVPVYMCGNTVSIINPYYTQLGISSRLREDTKFLRGDGFVLEQGFVESASRAQKDSGVNRAFANNEYVAYASQNVYLNDNYAFISKPEGKSKYVATLKYMNSYYAIREFAEMGIMYIDDKPDMSYKFKITVTTNDHATNYIMLKQNDLFLQGMRYYFEKGCFRFKDLRCKDALLQALTY